MAEPGKVYFADGDLTEEQNDLIEAFSQCYEDEDLEEQFNAKFIGHLSPCEGRLCLWEGERKGKKYLLITLDEGNGCCGTITIFPKEET